MTAKHIAYRDFQLTDGAHTFGAGSVRYTYTITSGRPAVTWATAADGFAPAEDASCDVLLVEVKMGPRDHWHRATGDLLDMLGEVPDAWLIEQATEAAA